MKAFVSIPQGAIFNTFFTPENIRLAEDLGEVVWNTENKKMTEDELAQKISDCDVYIALWGSPALTSAVLENASQLKLMCVLGSTVSPYVTEEMWDRGVRVISGFDYYAESTAEGAISYMLSALRRIPYYSERLKSEGIWKLSDDRTEGLIGKTVGVVGYGGVGRHLSRMLSSWSVRLKVCDIRSIPDEEKRLYRIEQCDMDELFSTCDIISINLPYNPGTHHIIDERLISKMKSGALIVNTARGAVIDEPALIRRLQKGDIRAALDVLEKEPIEPSNPLMTLDNALLTPHQAGVTTDLRAVLTRELLIESADFIDKGIPLKSEITREYARGMSKK
jgi:phosphoglycerate dehydrogenase-like enzyme